MLSVHQGCGLTNAMTGIAEAAKSRTPLLVLAADVAGSAVGSNFRIDQDALVRSVGAVPERVHSPGSAVDDVVRAYRTASHGRRTVVLMKMTTSAKSPSARRPRSLTPRFSAGSADEPADALLERHELFVTHVAPEPAREVAVCARVRVRCQERPFGRQRARHQRQS